MGPRKGGGECSRNEKDGNSVGFICHLLTRKLLSQLPFALDRFEAIVYLRGGLDWGSRRGGPSSAL